MSKVSPKILNLTGATHINKSAPEVFRYVSDLRNDKFWRKEINKTTIQEPEIKLHTVALEDSFLSKRVPNHTAALRCNVFELNKKVVFQSLPENAFYLKNSRSTEAINPAETKLTYNLEFDTAVVKHGLGFQLQAFFLKFYTKVMMQKYLQKLKQVLETAPVNS